MFARFVGTLTAFMLSINTVMAADFVMATDGGCNSSDEPSVAFIKFKTDDELYLQRGVIFYSTEWSCKVKRFYYLDEAGPFEGTCWGEDDDGDYHVNVHLWLDHEEETINVSFDGREYIIFSEECSE